MTTDYLDLEVPYGLHPHGFMVKAEEADKGTQYLCPECEDVLVLRAGDYKVKHFAHKANSECTGEGIIHKTAKLLIGQAIREHNDPAQKRTLSLLCSCGCCNEVFYRKLMHGTFSSMCEEKYIGNYKCDLVAQKQDRDVLAIEIFNTHKVDEQKAKNLALHWIELKAEDVLENPYDWQPTQGQLKEVLCDKCKEHIRKLNDVISKWGLGSYPAAIYKDVGKGQFLAEIETCYQCKEEIPVFWWRGVPFSRVEPPKENRPRTLRLIFSKTYGARYWANTCPNCNATQGDNFLFIGIKGKKPVFKGLPLESRPEIVKAKSEAFGKLVNHLFRNF